MTKNTDWWPSTRTGQLEMAKQWLEVLAEHGDSWNIPKDIVANFRRLVRTAENALHDVQNENANTTVAKTKCGEAFEEMTAAARDMKRWFFHAPPLKNHELVMLGLKPRDRKATPSGTPTARLYQGRTGYHRRSATRAEVMSGKTV